MIFPSPSSFSSRVLSPVLLTNAGRASMLMALSYAQLPEGDSIQIVAKQSGIYCSAFPWMWFYHFCGLFSQTCKYRYAPLLQLLLVSVEGAILRSKCRCHAANWTGTLSLNKMKSCMSMSWTLLANLEETEQGFSQLLQIYFTGLDYINLRAVVCLNVATVSCSGTNKCS